MVPAERKYSLIVFDWDHTLTESADKIVECIQARRAGWPGPMT